MKLKELVEQAAKDRQSALASLQAAKDRFDEEEYLGVGRALKGISNAAPGLGKEAVRPLIKQLRGIASGMPLDQADRSYIRAWLLYLRQRLVVDEGDEQGKEDEPDQEVGADSVDVGLGAGDPAAGPPEDGADQVD
ncbi:MAG: hypothetical protein JRN39_03425 [Nitrososphaerota archaeon]|nr:hypothetical protein [Nitrososphaerota archaeon]MDG6939434.1 hypothetical protein [Nitrososphaerota archaeon]